jgi:hypothetical protein
MSADVSMNSDNEHNEGQSQSVVLNGNGVPKVQDCQMSDDDDLPLVC